MVRYLGVIFLIVGVLNLSGCQNQQVQQNFDSEVGQRIKKHAQVFTNEAYQEGSVPLKTYIKMTGVITKTDAMDGSKIGKSDRFVLESEGTSYQVINSSDELVAVADKIVVYGEYQGFIQGEKISVE